MQNVDSLDTALKPEDVLAIGSTLPDDPHGAQQQMHRQNGVSARRVPIFASKQVATKQVSRQEVSPIGQQLIHAEPPSDGLAYRLRHFQEVFTRADFQAAGRQHAKGKLTVQEKIALLFDAGTFVENQVPSPGLDPRHGERRLVTGHGRINGRHVATALFDASIAAGAVTMSTGKKLIAQMQGAETQGCPLLIDWDSGGADIHDGIVSLDIVRQVFTQITEISGRIPTLSLISGLNAGMGAYAPVMTDTVIMIDGSMMAVTGPRVIKVATGETVTPEEMGGAALHSETSGEAHYRVPDYPVAARLARQYLSYLPQSMWSFPPDDLTGEAECIRQPRDCGYPGAAKRLPETQRELGCADLY